LKHSCFSSWRYSRSFPISWSKTELAASSSSSTSYSFCNRFLWDWVSRGHLRGFLLKCDVPPGIPRAFLGDPSLLNLCLFSQNHMSHPSDIKKCAATPRSKNLNCDRVMRRVCIWVGILDNKIIML
jgi:hypothetical protein